MEVPPELHSRYIERRKKDLEICIKSLEKKNYMELERVGHQLKGNGETFGHQVLAHIGSKMETAAAEGDSEEIKKTLREFSNWLQGYLN